MFKNLKGKNINKNPEETAEKTPEEKLKEQNIKKRKTYTRIAVMWVIAAVLGFGYHRIAEKAKTAKVVFTRTDEAPKELKDKIYIFYPKDNSVENMEIIIPKVQSKDELLKATITETIKKMEADSFIPEIDLKDVSYYVVDKKIYLDLPEKVFQNVTNAKSELLIIYSFVNSLTNIGGIDRVRILINNTDLEKVKYANLLKDYTYQKNI